jgi:acyl-CoA thioesterase FadM
MNEGNVSLEKLPGNICFGCGQDTPEGLNIDVRRDPGDPRRIIGALEPTEHMSGFPGVTHGGVIYTALDCMGAWTASTLRDEKAIWLLRSADIKYHKPAPADKPIQLSSWIGTEGAAWRSVVVRAEAHDARGDLLADASFKLIPLTAEKFKEVTGFEEIPANWMQFLEKKSLGA